jgi:hypothetical protein
MKVVQLADQRADSLAGAVEAVDRIRARLLSGEYVGFLAVCLAANDDARVSCARTDGVSITRMLGALAQLTSWYHHRAATDDA